MLKAYIDVSHGVYKGRDDEWFVAHVYIGNGTFTGISRSKKRAIGFAMEKASKALIIESNLHMDEINVVGKTLLSDYMKQEEY